MAVGHTPHPRPRGGLVTRRPPRTDHAVETHRAGLCAWCVYSHEVGRGAGALRLVAKQATTRARDASPSDSTDGPHDSVDENVGGLGLLFCRRDTHVMSASRPILVVARVVEALPRLAADHVPHALAQRLARGLDLGGQFA